MLAVYKKEREQIVVPEHKNNNRTCAGQERRSLYFCQLRQHSSYQNTTFSSKMGRFQKRNTIKIFCVLILKYYTIPTSGGFSLYYDRFSRILYPMAIVISYIGRSGVWYHSFCLFFPVTPKIGLNLHFKRAADRRAVSSFFRLFFRVLPKYSFGLLLYPAK